MKQSHPAIFEDLCLYSEICLILAEYSFRLFSRRFVHELFMDVNFKDLLIEPCKILNLKLPASSSVSPGGDGPNQMEGGGAAGAAGGQSSTHSGGHGLNNPLKLLGNLTEVASDDALSPT